MEGIRNIWNTKYNSALSSIRWLQSGRHVQPTRQEKIKGRKEQVYDIINCGPNNRFTIRGADKKPFIVHNCVQHLARGVLLGMMLEIKRKYGLVPKLSVHDELIYIVNNSKADEALEQVQSIMRTPPAWWPELVVWSEGSTGQTYGEAK